jgi:hypothetical protein
MGLGSFMMNRLGFVLISLLSAANLYGEGLLASGASVPSSGALGIPTTLVVTVRNATTATVQIPRFFTVVAESPSGDRFRPFDRWDPYVDTISPLYTDASLALPPGVARSFELPLGRLLADGVFGDRRLHHPGEWRFDVILDSRLAGSSKVPEAPATTALDIRYTVVNEGVDASTWAKIEQVSGEANVYHALHADRSSASRSLLEEARGSSYEVDLLLFAGLIEAHEILEREVRPAIRDSALHQLAHMSHRRALGHYLKGETRESKLEFARSVEAWKRMQREALTDIGRLTAAREMEEVDRERKAKFD